MTISMYVIGLEPNQEYGLQQLVLVGIDKQRQDNSFRHERQVEEPGKGNQDNHDGRNPLNGITFELVADKNSREGKADVWEDVGYSGLVTFVSRIEGKASYRGKSRLTPKNIVESHGHDVPATALADNRREIDEERDGKEPKLKHPEENTCPGCDNKQGLGGIGVRSKVGVALW